MNEPKKLDRSEVKRRRKALHDVLADDGVVQAFLETVTDANARAQLEADPKGHLQRKGGRIPAEVNVEVIQEGASSGIRLVIKGKNESSGVELKVERGKTPDTSPGARAQQKRLNDETYRLITSDAHLDAFEQSLGDPQAAEKAKADARGYLKAKGLEIPEDIEVKFVEKSNPGYCGIFCGFVWGVVYVCWFECKIYW